MRKRNSQLGTVVHNGQVLIGAITGIREEIICSRDATAALSITSTEQQVFISIVPINISNVFNDNSYA